MLLKTFCDVTSCKSFNSYEMCNFCCAQRTHAFSTNVRNASYVSNTYNCVPRGIRGKLHGITAIYNPIQTANNYDLHSYIM